MLRTTDGRSMSMVVKELEGMAPLYDNLQGTKMEFTIDGSTSEFIDHDGELINVKISDIYVVLEGGGNTIKIPNYNHSSLPSMIERAVELLLFEYGCDMK